MNIRFEPGIISLLGGGWDHYPASKKSSKWEVPGGLEQFLNGYQIPL